MVKSMERFAELYELWGLRFEMLNGILWREYNRMVVPLGPVKLSYTISKEEVKYLLYKFPKSLMVRLTDGFSHSTENLLDNCWYAVVCYKFKELDELSANTRSKIRRGLKNCRVEKIDANLIANYGFDVYVSAFERYKDVKKPFITDEKIYQKRILATKKFDDIVHYWGVFYNNKLIAYSENFIYDNIEAAYSTIKFHPDFLKLYPSYALIFEMNKFYLRDSRFEYVNDGFRSILHQTNVQNYLIQKFDFQKRYTNLSIFYRWYLSIYLSLTYPIRNFLSKLNSKLAGLYKLEEIRREYHGIQR